MFIHIGPDETDTLKRIPKKLLFPAIGLPMGHVIMGYNRNGECPMLVNDRCSIYNHRPQTCRDYDCRVFAATGVVVDERNQPEIHARVRGWEFDLPTEKERKEYEWLQAAAIFIQEHREAFPSGLVPDAPVPLALLAMKRFKTLQPLGSTVGESLPPDSDMVKAIHALLWNNHTTYPFVE